MVWIFILASIRGALGTWLPSGGLLATRPPSGGSWLLVLHLGGSDSGAQIPGPGHGLGISALVTDRGPRSDGVSALVSVSGLPHHG